MPFGVSIKIGAKIGVEVGVAALRAEVILVVAARI